jgi:7,8-dihydro-6-hydroxymethylpterin dimethyltransferase
MSAQPANVTKSLSNTAWFFARNINSILPDGKLPQPTWAPGPHPRSSERVPMATGVPRRTLSLCPECNREAADSVNRGESSVTDFRDRPGIIEAEIVKEAGRILMRKACEKHGPFEDVLSNHPDFFKRMETLAFGKDFNCTGDEIVHNHGANSIKTGRGTYLIVDLTNRCNMFCSPCYMDANAASYVHELDMNDVAALFERAKSFKPQREINVLFSGGETTLSPIFQDAVQHAKSVGFHRLHVATNGICFAQEIDFAVRAKASGLHGVYLQFDGVTEEKNSHRGMGNYMEVKRRALDNIAAAGMKTTLQVTVVNGLNNDTVGDIIRFVADHIEKIHGVIFQPVMFCGRDEDVSADGRYARRYPVSQIAYDLQAQTSFGWEPMRDWFPASAYAVFANLCDVLHPEAALGSLFCDIHPNQGIFSPILINSRTREVVSEGFYKGAVDFAGRYLSTGAPDPSFGTNGLAEVATPINPTLALLTGDSLLAWGGVGSPAQFNSAGDLQATVTGGTVIATKEAGVFSGLAILPSNEGEPVHQSCGLDRALNDGNLAPFPFPLVPSRAPACILPSATDRLCATTQHNRSAAGLAGQLG